jgi:argininosuccinate lyase
MPANNFTNPFWSEGESKDFGKVAVSYAAGEDIVYDAYLVKYECLVNQAHIAMLYKQKIINKAIAKEILLTLKIIEDLNSKGEFLLKLELEDVHSNVEYYLIDELGVEIGGYLRFGIARNDQVYTDIRMYIREKMLIVANQLIQLIIILSKKAAEYKEVVMPGFTHLRISQPITYAHFLTAKAYHFLDDLNNILYTYDLVNSCPLGIFEMAGTHLPLDRKYTACLLGFDSVTPNSLYTANQRGELEAKVLADLTILATHIRRTMTEIIILSSEGYQLFGINQQYVSGGTAQPNLTNPDTLEVVRANMAKIIGAFVETVAIMDVLPSGFNRDTQQTKPTMMKSLELIINTLPVFTGILATLVANREKMEKMANLNFAYASDVTLQLADCGKVDFRSAYKVVKTLIKEKYLKDNFAKLSSALVGDVSSKVLGKSIKVSQSDLDAVSDARLCAFSHTSEGGSSPKEVETMIKDLEMKATDKKKIIKKKEIQIEKAYKELERLVSSII